MATIVSDNFNDNSLDTTTWYSYADSGATLTETNQQIEIALVDNVGSTFFAAIGTNTSQSAVDTIVTARLVQQPVDIAYGEADINIVAATAGGRSGYGLAIGAAGYSYFYEWDDAGSASNFAFISGPVTFPLLVQDQRRFLHDHSPAVERRLLVDDGQHALDTRERHCRHQRGCRARRRHLLRFRRRRHHDLGRLLVGRRGRRLHAEPRRNSQPLRCPEASAHPGQGGHPHELGPPHQGTRPDQGRHYHNCRRC